ncbi:MAG: leucine-rich repeat protein, partial [Lachnospiraceae bacterium]|nr:leucine-rich repeat protein [Lachnospiraceae bacterium]
MKKSVNKKRYFKALLLLIMVGIIAIYYKNNKSIKAADVVTDYYEFHSDTGELLIKNTSGLANFANDENIDLSKVTTLTFADRITNIYTNNYDGPFAGSALTKVNLNDVTSIQRYMFYGCKYLTDIDLSNVTYIDNNAFNGCSSLKSVNIENVTSLGTFVFYGCSSLEEVEISPQLTSTNMNTFSGTALKTIDLKNVTSIGQNAFSDVSTLTEVQGTNIKSVAYSAFVSCDNLTSINLQNANEIAQLAFWYCSKLSDVTFPNTAAYYKDAFTGCALDLSDGYPNGGSLNSFSSQNPNVYFTLNKYSDTIGENESFEAPIAQFKTKSGTNLSDLVSSKPEWLASGISVPTVTESGDEFLNKEGVYSRTYTANSSYANLDTTTQLYTLTVKKGNVVTDDYEFDPETGNLLIKTNNGILGFSEDTNIDEGKITSVSFGDNITSLLDDDNSAVPFTGTKITKVDLNKVTSIGSYVFCNCYNLTDIDLSKVEHIGRAAFAACDDLQSVDISSCKYIGNGAFVCPILTSCKFPDSAVYETNAFEGCALDLSNGYPKGGSIDSFSNQTPECFLSLNKTKETIKVEDDFIPPKIVYKTQIGTDYRQLIKNKPEWLASNARLPKMKESGDDYNTNQVGVYDHEYFVYDNVYTNCNSLHFILTVQETDATISPNNCTFDKNKDSTDYKDITITIDKDGYDLNDIVNGSNSLRDGTDYVVDGDKYTIKKAYLSSLENGDTKIEFKMNSGVNPLLTIEIKDSTPVIEKDASINPSEAIFNKTEGSDGNNDIIITLNKESYSLSSITDGLGDTLVKDTDYSVNGDKYTFVKKYFSKYEPGENCQIQFDMSGGTSPILYVSIVETREINGSISPVTAAYDKNPKGKYHKPIVETLEFAAYDLNSIKNGSYKLVENKDYVKRTSKSSSNIQLVNVSNSLIYEIKEEYLNKLKNGTAKITFDLNGGTDPVLTLSIMDTSSKDGDNGGNNDGGNSGGNGGNNNGGNSGNNDGKNASGNTGKNGTYGGQSNRYSGTLGSNIPIKTGDSANVG